MIVQGGNLDAIVAQRTQHRIDFIGGEDEIPGDRGLAAAGRREVDCLEPMASGTAMPAAVTVPARRRLT
jgi:hypothetical protein